MSCVIKTLGSHFATAEEPPRFKRSHSDHLTSAAHEDTVRTAGVEVDCQAKASALVCMERECC